MHRYPKYHFLLLTVIFLSFYFQGKLFGQYSGGNGSGYSNFEQTIICNLTSIYTNSGDDGFGYQYTFQNCQSRLFSVGGNGNGYSAHSFLQICPVSNVFQGNQQDGFSPVFHSLCPKDSMVITVFVISHPSCTSPSQGTATVSIPDEYPYWHSTPDYTYIWKNEAGDTLTGYPAVKSSANDTVTDLSPGLYTIIVSDANLNVDSAHLYINDCLYRGGEGPGFAFDETKKDCQISSVYKGTEQDGFDDGTNIETCNNFMSSTGGNGNGFSVDTFTNSCLSPPLYTGGTADGYGMVEDMYPCESLLFSVGGDGSGFGTDSIYHQCLPLNIYSGTQNDGFDHDALVLSCYSSLFTVGGEGNGYSSDTSNENCAPISIYANSGADGFDHNQDIINCESILFTSGGEGNGFSTDTACQICTLPNIFKGDGSDGFDMIYEIPCLYDSMVINAGILEQISCPVTINNGSAIVSIIDGFPGWRSIPDFTYVWKKSNGDTLTGYPKITSSTGDTVYNLGVDDYTVIVTDIAGNIDSALVYISDCLYRGGIGIGFDADTSWKDCLLPSVYRNSGADGFDLASDTINCLSSLFTLGGDGNGFSLDTALQNCKVTNIYTNSGDDGFDHNTDILNCEITYFSIGGDGNGFATDTSFGNCPVEVITAGGEGDGADQLYSGCTPYIYDLPSTNNSCLSADTITSNGSNQWQHIMKNGQLVASVKDNGNTLGKISTEFYINDNTVRIDPFSILPSYYLDRNFKIMTENLIFGQPVRMRLYFLANELQALKNEDINVSSINDLGITKYTGKNENCSLLDNTDHNDSLNYIHITNKDWDYYENGYYLEFDITGFSEFYLNNSTSLPVPYEIAADLEVTSDFNGQDISCYGAYDGKATITPVYGIAPFTYQWNDPLAQSDSVAAGLSAGIYEVTVIDNNGVTFSDSITITQPDSITIEYTTTNTCESKNEGIIDLTVSGGTDISGYDYTWYTSNGSGLVAGAEDQLTLSGGKYSITVQDANACSKTDSMIIYENPNSIVPAGISITNNATCPGTIKTLTPDGGALGYNAVWRWYADAGFSSLLHTGDSYDTDPATPTSYWLRAEGDCDTSTAVTTIVSVLSQSVTADSIAKTDDNIAPGTNDTLIIRGGSLGEGASWRWYLDAAGTSSAGPDGDTIIVAPSATTQYWVRAEGTCNTTDMITTTVTINPLPLKPATPAGPDSICQDAQDTDYTTSAAGATSYIWYINPPEAGTITGSGATVTVDWSTDYFGSVTITVRGENISGTGPVSDPVEIWIWKLPQTGPAYHIPNIGP